MAEALSRSEVESLLSAMNPLQTLSNSVTAEDSSALGEHITTSQLARRVVGLFERFRHAMASATGEMLPEPARLKRHMPVRVPFSDLRNRANENRLLVLVESEQSGGDLLVVFDRQFAVQLATCMLGQGAQPGEPSGSPSRETLSPVEQRLLLRWLKESLEGVTDPALWEPIEMELVNSPRDLDAFHAQSPWWCEIWEMKAESLRGRIELCGAWDFFSALTAVAKVEEDNEVRIEPDTLSGTPKDEKPSGFERNQSNET